MLQPDSDDEFPDDIGHLDLSNVPGLQELPVASLVRSLDHALRPAVPASPSRSSLPSEYDYDDEIDETFLAACDALEARFTQHRDQLEDHSTTQQVTLNFQAHDDPRKRGRPPLGSPPASKKGRVTTEDQTKVANTMLERFEIEINCPICFDVLVAAHVYNPCGHSSCGQCAQGWVSQNKMSPTCAVCRTALSTTKPLIPNYALDGVVQQYIRSLAINGRSEWQEKGERLAEWNKRHEKWQRLVAMITQAESAKAKGDVHNRMPRLPLASFYMQSAFETYLAQDDDDDGDGDGDDDDDEDQTYEQDVEVLPRRVVPSRQRTVVS